MCLCDDDGDFFVVGNFDVGVAVAIAVAVVVSVGKASGASIIRVVWIFICICPYMSYLVYRLSRCLFE